MGLVWDDLGGSIHAEENLLHGGVVLDRFITLDIPPKICYNTNHQLKYRIMRGKLLERSFPRSPFKNFKKQFTIFYLKVLGILKPFANFAESEFAPSNARRLSKKGLSGGWGRAPVFDSRFF